MTFYYIEYSSIDKRRDFFSYCDQTKGTFPRTGEKKKKQKKNETCKERRMRAQSISLRVTGAVTRSREERSIRIQSGMVRDDWGRVQRKRA